MVTNDKRIKLEGLLRIKICQAQNVGKGKHLITAVLALVISPWLIYYCLNLNTTVQTPVGTFEQSLPLTLSRIILVACSCFCILQFFNAIRASGVLTAILWDNSFVVFSHGWTTFRTKEASLR